MTTQQILQGVHDWTNGKIVYDISVAHPDGQGKPTPYADLTAALGTGGANIPEELRKGGMSVKFIKGSVQSSDNKYVQYRLMSQSFSTTEGDWQGVDEEPIDNSENILASGGIYKMNVYSGTPIPDYRGMIDELYVIDMPAGNIVATCYSNSFRLWTIGVDVYADIKPTYNPIENGVVYPIQVYNTNDSEHYPSNKVVGYIVFKDYAAFSNLDGGANNRTAIINRAYCENSNNSPLIKNSFEINQVKSSVKNLGDIVTALDGRVNTVEEKTEDLEKNLSTTTIFYPTTDESFENFAGNSVQAIRNIAISQDGLKGKTFNNVFIPVSGTEDGVLCDVRIAQTDNQYYLDNVPSDAKNNVLVLLENIKFNNIDDYTSIDLGRDITITKNTVVVFITQKSNISGKKLVTKRVAETHTTVKNTFLDTSTTTSWSDMVFYRLAGTTWGSTAFSVMPAFYYVGDVKKEINEIKESLTNEIARATGKEADLQEQIDNLEPSATETEIVLPDKINVVSGDPIQIFYRSIIKANNAYEKNILLTCNKGKQLPRFFEYTPNANGSEMGNVNFRITLREDDLVENNHKDCNLVVVGSGSQPSSNINVVCVGDSLTTGGQWVEELSRRLTQSGGTPAGKNFSNITFCGEHGTGNAKYFGVGGWLWRSYATAGNTAYRFFVTNCNDPIAHEAKYTNNGTTFRVVEVNITEGTGNILAEVYGGGTNPPTGDTLTKTSGVGPATIVFDSYAQAPANPFWDAVNQKITFIPYADAYCNGVIDAMYVELGGNGLSPNQTNFSDTIGYIKNFADALHSEFPNAKLKIIGTVCISFNGGAGANEGATGVRYADQLGIFYAMLNLNKVYQQIANSTETSGTSGDAYNTFIEYIDVISQIDCENNMPQNTFPVNTRNPKTETRDTNEMHPSIYGYYQLADAVYRNFISEFCQ